jgi:hypothetical protein
VRPDAENSTGRETGGSGALNEVPAELGFRAAGGETERARSQPGLVTPVARVTTQNGPPSGIVSKDTLPGVVGGLNNPVLLRLRLWRFPPSKEGELLATTWLCEGHDR